MLTERLSSYCILTVLLAASSPIACYQSLMGRTASWPRKGSGIFHLHHLLRYPQDSPVASPVTVPVSPEQNKTVRMVKKQRSG